MALAQANARTLPPPDSAPVVRSVDVIFPSTPSGSAVDRETYLYYIQTKASRPDEGDWVPLDLRTIADDVKRLWATAFLEDISVDVTDEPYDNGVVGKHVVFRLEERRRIKFVEYKGSKALDSAEIDRKLVQSKAQIAIPSMIDAPSIKRVEDLVREMLRERGHPLASVSHRVADIPGTPFVRLVFLLDEGPRVRVRRITFASISAANERAVRRSLRTTKENATFSDTAFDADAQRILDYYHENGYVMATVGAPVSRVVEALSNAKTRWVDLQIPVSEGKRYRLRRVSFEGNRVATTDALRPYFGLRPGAYYDDSRVRRGFEQARQWYGARGYYEFTGYPDLHPDAAGDSLLDVMIRLSEGDQYFIRRIALTGNTTTHDEVVRRQLGLMEGQVLDTEALKSAMSRLNRLAFFQPIAESDLKVEKVAGPGRLVDVTLDVKEKPHDNVNFGGGVSQGEGLFGSVSYSTQNFLGRGQQLTLGAEQGLRGGLYQATLAHPYLFGGALSGSFSVFGGRTAYDTPAITDAYSESRRGATISLGRSLTPFTRINFGYTYEVDAISMAESLLGTAFTAAGSPALGAGDLGSHADGHVSLGVVHNTIDDPFMPHGGIRLSAGMQLASVALGGEFDYVKPEAEAVWYGATSRRTGIGVRAQLGTIKTYGPTTDVPYHLRYALGGDTQIRGVDLRTVGPLDANGRVLGGTSYTLFNAEYHVDLTRNIRLLGFGDAGQAFDAAHPFDRGDLRTSTGVELRVVLPFLHVPLRFIYYWNPSRDSFQPNHGFRFSMGGSF